MASIHVSDLGIEFKIYGNRSRTLRSKVLSGFGGRISQQADVISVRALRGISLDLKDGDRLGLIGVNGSGKTTLLRALAGVYEPTSGSIEVEGSVAALTDMSMGMDPDASGYENILMRSICMGKTWAEAQSIVKEVEEFTELGEHLHLPLRTFSTGMSVRLAFAVSTNVAPDILIMDEMVGAGDVHFVEKARKRVNTIIDSVGILVIASHSTEIIKNFCNKAALLHKGELIEYGDVDAVLKAYLKA